MRAGSVRRPNSGNGKSRIAPPRPVRWGRESVISAAYRRFFPPASLLRWAASECLFGGNRRLPGLEELHDLVKQRFNISCRAGEICVSSYHGCRRGPRKGLMNEQIRKLASVRGIVALGMALFSPMSGTLSHKSGANGGHARGIIVRSRGSCTFAAASAG